MKREKSIKKNRRGRVLISSGTHQVDDVITFLLKEVKRSFEPKALSGAHMEIADTFEVEVTLGDIGEVCLLGKELADESIRVFIGAFFPWMMGITEVDRNSIFFFHKLPVRELTTSIYGDTFDSSFGKPPF